jgi:hypothetical protein
MSVRCPLGNVPHGNLPDSATVLRLFPNGSAVNRCRRKYWRLGEDRYDRMQKCGHLEQTGTLTGLAARSVGRT